MLTNTPLATAIAPPFAGGRDAWSGSGLLPVRRRQSGRDGTLKLLLELPDGQTIESVSMPMPATRSICLSTQVGCPLGCTFCRTGLAGFTRNLTAAEIMAQARTTALESHAATGLWPERAVFMGMGEPLLNFEALRDCLAMLADGRGPHLSWRKIQVSTVGIPDRLEELGRLRLALPAISLHAPAQDLRDRLMPGAKGWPLRDLIPVLAGYPLPGRERVTVEYILIRDTNDSDGHAEQLHELLREVRVKVNLIPCNPAAGSPHAPPDPRRVEGFARRLKDLGGTAFVRRSLGQDILAACGQLRGAGESEPGDMIRPSATEAP
jgi:23S rRNA (adenine2503-C2)-methyltransferase